MKVLAIDLGTQTGKRANCGCFDGGGYWTVDNPGPIQIWDILEPFDVLVIEKVWTGSVLKQRHYFECMAEMLEVDVVLVHPRRWQKHFCLTGKKQEHIDKVKSMYILNGDINEHEADAILLWEYYHDIK